MKRFLAIGFALWLAGTLLLRLAPERFLRPDRDASTLILYAVSFALMFALIRWRLVSTLGPNEAPAAVIALLLPTLILDAFSSAFFSAVFPNLSAGAAGLFGGWMLISCGGAVAGVLWPR